VFAVIEIVFVHTQVGAGDASYCAIGPTTLGDTVWDLFERFASRSGEFKLGIIMAGNDEWDLVQTLSPGELTESELTRQIVLYVETTVVKPLVANGVNCERLAEACLELAIDVMEMHKGRLAAAVMLQKATRRAFTSSSPAGAPSGRAQIVTPDAVGA